MQNSIVHTDSRSQLNCLAVTKRSTTCQQTSLQAASQLSRITVNMCTLHYVHSFIIMFILFILSYDISGVGKCTIDFLRACLESMHDGWHRINVDEECCHWWPTVSMMLSFDLPNSKLQMDLSCTQTILLHVQTHCDAKQVTKTWFTRTSRRQLNIKYRRTDCQKSHYGTLLTRIMPHVASY